MSLLGLIDLHAQSSYKPAICVYIEQAASLMEQHNRLAHSGKATSGAKSDVMSLLGDPDFL